MEVAEEYRTKAYNENCHLQSKRTFHVTNIIRCPHVSTATILVNGIRTKANIMCHSKDIKPIRVLDIQRRDDYEAAFIPMLWECLSCHRQFVWTLCISTVEKTFPHLLQQYWNQQHNRL